MYYTGRDMATSHRGMGVSESDWLVFIGHVKATMDKLRVPERETSDVLAFIESTKADIVKK